MAGAPGKPKKLKTTDQVREEFRRHGKTITSWARENGFRPNDVFEVLGGRNKGLRGKSHEIAVRLGLKEGVIEEKKK